jgi:hypothetical protein
MRLAINGIAAIFIIGCLAAMEEAEKVTRHAAKETGAWAKRHGKECVL